MTDRDLLILLHGRGADEADLLPLAPLIAPGAEVLAPRAPVPFGPGFAWAEPDDRVSAGLGLDAAAERVARRIDESEAGRVLVLGFSQGAGVAVELLRQRPERIERTVLLSAFVPGPGRDDREVAALRPPVLWGRGAEDPLFDARVLDDAQRWLERHTTLTAHVYPGLGHGISEEEIGDVARFLAR